MANLCSNYITIQGDPKLIDIIAQDYMGHSKEINETNFSFSIMSPVPDNIQDDYYWRIQNWGNKWDGSDCYIDIFDDQIYLSLDTAWSPCDQWTYKLIELCPGVDIYHEYYEPGAGYIGWIQHSKNDGPKDYEETCYTSTNDVYAYWLTVLKKEYETLDWLSDYIDELYDDETITKAEADEVLQMINDDSPLETLIARCFDLEIL